MIMWFSRNEGIAQGVHLEKLAHSPVPFEGYQNGANLFLDYLMKSENGYCVYHYEARGYDSLTLDGFSRYTWKNETVIKEQHSNHKKRVFQTNYYKVNFSDTSYHLSNRNGRLKNKWEDCFFSTIDFVLTPKDSTIYRKRFEIRKGDTIQLTLKKDIYNLQGQHIEAWSTISCYDSWQPCNWDDMLPAVISTFEYPDSNSILEKRTQKYRSKTITTRCKTTFFFNEDSTLREVVFEYIESGNQTSWKLFYKNGDCFKFESWRNDKIQYSHVIAFL